MSTTSETIRLLHFNDVYECDERAKDEPVGGLARFAGAVRALRAEAAAAGHVGSLLLFGGEVDVRHEDGTVVIDGQISFEAPGRVAVLVRELRAELDKLLSDKLASPEIEIGAHPVVAAIVSLINTEKAGFA